MKTIAASEARKSFASVIDDAAHEPVVIRRRQRNVAVVLSMHDNPAYVRAAHEAGASAYLVKDCLAEDIVHAVRAVMAAPDVPLLPGAMPGATPSGAPPPTDTAPGPALTPREQEVLDLIAEGLSSRDIGARLSMSARTVETHRTHLRRKLRLTSAAALVRLAVERRHRRTG